MGSNYVCLDVVGVLFVLIGLGLIGKAVKDWRRYRKSENWIPIAALITTSYVDESVGSGEDPATYTPIIRYAYEFMGKNYEGSRVSFGSEEKSYEKRKKAEKVVARHPAGSQPTIYYNPDDPAQSVLERKFDPYQAIWGLIVGLIGAGLIYAQYHQG